jgi:HEAT repeat protein
MQSILSRCKPHHGDRFVSSWLTSDNEDMRNLGAYALGGIGLGWAAPALLERCADPAESIAVRRTSTFAAGVIGGAETLDRLRALQLHDETLVAIRDDALTMCIGDAKDEAQFRDLARDLIARSPSELCWVYRAIGLRGDDALLGLVRDGLRAKETSVRGDAALALARLAGPSEADALRRAREEASSTRENLLASLALLTIGEELPGDPELEQLRSMLDAESFMYRSVTQQDILAALRSSPHPLAVGIADAWQPIYDSSSAY